MAHSNTGLVRWWHALALAALLVVNGPTAAGARLPAEWQHLVGSYDSMMERDNMVGGSIALVQDGEIVARRNYGFADKARGKRVDDDTIFHWASNTKTLNAIAMMQLRDRGLLSLEDPVTRYVPELRLVHNSFGSMDAITLVMLMTHTAGFQSVTWTYRSGKDWEPFEPTRWEQLVAMMPYQEIEFAPGSKFSYSNPAWIYLARTLEGLTNDPWEYYIQKNILAPLQLTRSYFGNTPAYLRTDRSHSYEVRKGADGKLVTSDLGGDFDPGITIPNGGWNAPLADLATYIGFLTRAHSSDAQRVQRYDSVLKHSTLEEMWQPRVAVDWDADDHSAHTMYDGEKMGLAFFLIQQGSKRIVGHTGGQNGFSTFFYFDPVTGRGVVGAFNTGNGVRAEGVKSAFTDIRQAALQVFH